ncbi:uncharacterized protein KQ657_003631 [Scheffersomyces spartinae]|uniref:BZIP domain-containing protein n=1 Tax=Scheffersomyces spartinae TaxID=45513 RepID=A0A9P7VC69_9ASCO|nr:uncharacterized protein KQ657_003631 [Scheffersomyces spartinae]KAG7195110.1 hypothetical protein KQ657_003631 [Scheffersomyces spartinae]
MDFQPLDYLNDLNLVINSPVVGDNTNSTSPNGGASADLAMFSHSDFFDFDVLGQDNIVPIKPSVTTQSNESNSTTNNTFQFESETDSYQVSQYPESATTVSSMEQNTYNQSQYVKIEPQEETFLASVSNLSAAPTAVATPINDNGEFGISSVGEAKFSAIHAANEDKRKRNTAASARFRIKKKLKEQQMEQRTKELQDRVQLLEKKLRTLEMENRCLKSLVAQKSEKKSTDLVESIKQRSLQTTSEPVFQFT